MKNQFKTYRPARVTIVPNGNMVYFTGAPADLRPVLDWLFNAGIVDSDATIDADDTCGKFSVQKSKLIAGIASRYSLDIADRLKPVFRGTRENLLERASAIGQRLAKLWVAAMSHKPTVAPEAPLDSVPGYSPERLDGRLTEYGEELFTIFAEAWTFHPASSAELEAIYGS